MGRAAGVARRRKKTANLRKRSRKTLKRVRNAQLKKTGGIACDEIRQEWNMSKSMKSNMSKMGLSHDPNYSMAKCDRELKKQKLYDSLECYTSELKKPQTVVARVQAKLLKHKEKKLKKLKFKESKMNDNEEEEEEDSNDDKKETKTAVVEALEKRASIPSVKNFRLGPETIDFCMYMIEKYGDNYEAMCRDKRNRYQKSAGQIKAEIRRAQKCISTTC